MLHTLLFVGIYLAGFVLTFAANGVFSFILYETVYFFSPNDRWWSYNIPDLRYSFLTVMLMFAAFAIKKFKHESHNRLLSVPQFRWVYALGLLYSIAWLYAVNPEEHQTAAVNYIKLIIIISVAYKLIDTDKHLDYAIWGYIFGCWYISFLTWQTGRNVGDRVEGIGTVDSPDANGIAAAIVPSLVLCLYYFWLNRNKFSKVLLAIAGVFVANALILINSRGAFLAGATSIAFFMFYMYFSSFQQKYQKLVAIWITMAGLAGVLYLADELFLERMATLKQVEVVEEEETGATRIIFWMSAWEMAKDYPFGNGVRGFDHYAPDYIPEYVDTGRWGRNRSVHSTWFEALTEIGYLGLLVLLLMVHASFRNTRACLATLKEKRELENYFRLLALEAALLCYLIAMSFMNRFRAEILYWLVLYTACAYNIYVLKPTKGKKIEESAGG